MRPLRVLYLCVGLNGLGGTANHLRLLMSHLDRRNVEPTLCIGTKIPDVLQAYFQETLPEVILYSNYKAAGYIPFLRFLLRLCRQKKFDVVHSFFIQSDVLAFGLKKVTEIPSIVSSFEGRLVTSTAFWKRALLGLLNKVIRGGFDCNVFISDYLLETYRARFSISATKTRRIYPGLPTSWYEPPARAPDQKAPCRVGYIGRLSPEKGCRIFLDAILKLDQRKFNAAYRLIGASPSDPDLARELAARGLTARLELHPWRQDLRPALAELDIVTIPSLEEGLSYVAMEALSQKRFVIASRVGGLPEVVRPDHNGLLVPAGNAEALTNAIVQAAGDWDASSRRAEAGYADCRSRFSASREASDFVELYYHIGRP